MPVKRIFFSTGSLLVLLAACDAGDKKKSATQGTESASSAKTEEALTPSKDSWNLIENLAKPTVQTGEPDRLAAALSHVRSDDVPEIAIDEFLAWYDAKGGLPWRGERRNDDIVEAKMHAYKIATAAMTRRPSDPRTRPAVAYLGQRFRGEGGRFLDSQLGFDLAEAKENFDGTNFAPTEAELRRAIALLAASGRWDIENDWTRLEALVAPIKSRKIGTPAMKKAADLNRPLDREKAKAMVALQEIVLSAPSDRNAIPDHIRAITAKHEDSWLVPALVGSNVYDFVVKMNATLTRYGVK